VEPWLCCRSCISLWHAIAEWGVQPRGDDWQALLEDSIDEFERRRLS
jgi:hypothetical protein